MLILRAHSNVSNREVVERFEDESEMDLYIDDHDVVVVIDVKEEK